jgi:hypothetical protein
VEADVRDPVATMVKGNAGRGPEGGVMKRDTSDPRVILHNLNPNSSNVLYVLDGEKMPVGWKPDSISPDRIAAIDVVKSEQAVRLFGQRGVNGAVAIVLKDYELHLELKDSVRLTDENGNYKPLFIVDGKEVTNAIMSALNPNRIDSIAVHKGDEVTRSYGDKGKNGVIVITLKKEVGIVALPDGRVAATMNTKDGPMTVIADTLRVHLQ